MVCGLCVASFFKFLNGPRQILNVGFNVKLIAHKSPYAGHLQLQSPAGAVLSKVVAQPLEDQVTHLSLSRLRPVLDLGH